MKSYNYDFFVQVCIPTVFIILGVGCFMSIPRKVKYEQPKEKEAPRLIVVLDGDFTSREFHYGG